MCDCIHGTRLGPYVETDEIRAEPAAAVEKLLDFIKKRKAMHYKNGREAKNGDKVVLVPSYGSPIVGILYDATAGNDYCNGKLAPTSPSDPCPNLKEVLHLDDVLAVLSSDVPDLSMIPAVVDITERIKDCPRPGDPGGPIPLPLMCSATQ